MKRYATVAVIAALAVGALVTGIAVAGGDDSPQGCNPGEWVKVTTVEPNGDRGTFTLKRPLPEGYSARSDGVTIYSDGRVEAPVGSTVECIAPTH